MKLLATILFLCMAAYHSNAQPHKQVSIPYSTTDTTRLYFKTSKLDSELKLQPLIISTDSFDFRFYLSEGSIIDIYSCDGATLYGSIINYTYSDKNFGKRKDRAGNNARWEINSSYEFIDSSTARKIFHLLLKIRNIPTEDSIKGWGLEGASPNVYYTFETTTPFYFNFKVYRQRSSGWPELYENTAIENWRTSVDSLLKLTSGYSEFIRVQKEGYFTSNNNFFYIWHTKHSRKMWRRYNKKHLNSATR